MTFKVFLKKIFYVKIKAKKTKKYFDRKKENLDI